VAAEYLLIHYGSNGQAVEAVRESLPKLDIVPPLALIVEAVYPIDGGTLVVATQQEEVLRVLNLVGEQKANCLQGLLATVNVIPQEEIVALWGEAPVLKQTQEIIVLAMDVPTNLKRCLKLQKDGL
jgi:hypothetical protein